MGEIDAIVRDSEGTCDAARSLRAVLVLLAPEEK